MRIVICFLAATALLTPPVSDAQIPRILSYQGVLTDTLGTPKPDGVYAFTFRIYETNSGGTAIWMEAKNVEIKGGLFSTELGDVTPLGAAVPFDRPYWLSTQPGGEPELSPRVPLTAVGYSMSSIVADTARYALAAPVQIFVDSARISGTVANQSITSGKIADTAVTMPKLHRAGAAVGQVLKWTGAAWSPGNDNAGGGMALPFNDSVSNVGAASFSVRNLAVTGSSDGIIGLSHSPDGAGLYGIATATGGVGAGVGGETNSPQGIGVLGYALATSGLNYGTYGESFSPDGVGAAGVASSSSGINFGVWGSSYSTGGTGVLGEAIAASGANSGVHGSSESPNGTGVYGSANSASGPNIGVRGQSASPSGYGMFALASATTGFAYGLYARSVSTQGTAVYGTATATTGSTDGVFGISQSTDGHGVHGLANAASGLNVGVWGQSNSAAGFGMYGLANAASGANTGIYGETNSTDGYAVYGRAGANSGVNYGVYGRSNSPQGFGVVGFASSGTGTGVYGLTSSSTGIAIVGRSPGIGVFAKSTLAGGGTTDAYPAIMAEDSGGVGVRGIGGQINGIGVWGRAQYGVVGIGTNGYGVWGSSLGSDAGYFSGNTTVTGLLSKGAGSFKIDHPLDPANKYLYHSFVESPDMMNVYNGNVTLDANGEATIDLPDWFEALNKDFRYQLTAIGGPGPNLYIASEVQGNRFRIAGGGSGMKVSWQVTGIRKDAFAEKHRIRVEENKRPEERGHYMHPEAFGLSEEMTIPANRPLEAVDLPQGANIIPEAHEPVRPPAPDARPDVGEIRQSEPPHPSNIRREPLRAAERRMRKR